MYRRLTLALTVALASSSVLAGWYGTTSFKHRIRLSVDDAKVSGTADLSSFVAVFEVTRPELKTLQSDCGDLVVTSSDGTTALSYDLDLCNTTTGRIIIWIRIPTLDGDAPTSLYVYFGNAAVANQNDRASTWSGWQTVYHFSESMTGGSADNSTGGTDGTYNGNRTWSDDRNSSGKLGYSWNKARGFGTCVGGTNAGLACDDPNGATNTADCASNGVCSYGGASNGGASTDDDREWLNQGYGAAVAFGGTGGTDLTISSWVKADSGAAITCATKDMHFWAHSGYNLDNDATRVRLYTRCASANGGDDLAHRLDNNAAQTTTDNSFTNGSWHHVALRINSDTTNNVATLLNGVSKLSGTFTAFTPDDNYLVGDITSSEQRLETLNEGSSGLDGELDEFRTYLGVLSDDWISTEYQNQNDPSTWYRLTGPKEQRASVR